MPLPEGYLPREGDMLTVRARVKWPVDEGETSVFVKVVGGSGDSVRIGFADVIDLYCKNWAPGDAAFYDEHLVEVIAVDEDQVWVRTATPGVFAPRKVVHANELLTPEQARHAAATPAAAPAGGEPGEDGSAAAETPLASETEAS